MKAVVVHQYGGPEVLKFEEYPDPAAGHGEVLLRVAATSVNPIDYKRRAGLTKDFSRLGRVWKAFPSATRCSLWRTILTRSYVS
jgi:NADPH:quinone reductase-like Zn-dependent oxidoreductase